LASFFPENREVAHQAVPLRPPRGESPICRRNDPFRLLRKPEPCAMRFRTTNFRVRRFLLERIGENGLILGSHPACRKRDNCKSLVPNQHSRHCSTFSMDDVTPIDRHRVTIGVVFEGRRTRAHPVKRCVEVEVPVGNAAQERNVVADCFVVGEGPGAILRCAQSAGLTVRTGAAATPSGRLRCPRSVPRMSPHSRRAPRRN